MAVAHERPSICLADGASTGMIGQIDFVTFRERVLAEQPSFEVEQDYFDWELAVTAVMDMEDEIKRLRRVASPP